MDHFIAGIVENVHLKVTEISATVTRAAATFFGGEKDFLSERVFDDVFIGGFKTDEYFVTIDGQGQLSCIQLNCFY